MEGLSKIETLTKEYATQRTELATLLGHLNEELARLKNKRLHGIKRQLAKAKEASHKLQNAIDAEPGLFVKPRTYTFHGVKVGFQKGKGGITWADDAQVVKLIRQYFPDQADALIKVTEKPVKGGLNTLEARDLKRLGCEVKDAGDEVVIKPVDGEVDKLVDALLKEEPETNADANAA